MHPVFVIAQCSADRLVVSRLRPQQRIRDCSILDSEFDFNAKINPYGQWDNGLCQQPRSSAHSPATSLEQRFGLVSKSEVHGRPYIHESHVM